MTGAMAVLLTYMVLREAMFWYQTQLLLNKLMSRDYATYQTIVSSAKMESHQPHPLEPDLPEDLRPLSGMG